MTANNETENSHQHWESIYRQKEDSQMSWFQESPAFSLELIRRWAPKKENRIIDVGGGSSRLVDELLTLGYHDLSVLDISQSALDRSRQRVGHLGENVNWIASDIRDFAPERPFNLWHDRALIHFMTSESHKQSYLQTLDRSTTNHAKCIFAAFSYRGPEKCSGLVIEQYDQEKLSALLGPRYQPLECFEKEHLTPSGKLQAFLFCVFEKMEN